MSSALPPAGVSPAAAWEEVTFAPPPVPLGVLADAIDVETGELESLTKRIHPVDAAVREQFRLERGSGVAVVNDGQAFRRIEYVTEGTQRQLEDEARVILAPFIERGHVRILRFEVRVEQPGDDPTGAVMTVHYENLLARRPNSVGVPA